MTLTFAYPNWNVGIVVWVWMLPLLFALWWGDASSSSSKDKKPWRRGFGLGYLAGLAFFIPNLAWVRHSSRVIHGAMDHSWVGWGPELLGAGAVLGLGAYLSVYWGIWGALAVTIGRPKLEEARDEGRRKWVSLSFASIRCGLVCAAAWVACEWLRGVVFTGFGWNGLGVAMRHHLAMIQTAEFVGVTGLSFLPVLVGCIGYTTVVRFRIEAGQRGARPHLDFFFAAFLVIANFFFGVNVLSEKPGETVKVRTLVVQQNIPQVVRWTPGTHEQIYQEMGELTRYGLITSKPDLVIWPETSLSYAFHDPNHFDFLNALFEDHQYALLTGTDIQMPNEPGYNGAALMQGSFENHELYRKIHLVPFGEYLPMRGVPGVEALLGGILPSDFAFGESTEPLKLEFPAGGGVQIIPLICFEDTVGRLARKFVRDAPQMIVNMTNDGWFLQSNENEVHLANAIFRCVELRRPMARSCNTGVSCFVDSHGRIAKADKLQDPNTGSVFIKGFLPKEVALEKNPPMTFYAKHGDVFSIAMAAVTALLALMGWIRRGQGR